MAIGLIGGSGLYEIEGIETIREVSVSTPYGEPSAPYTIGALEGKEIVFLARHGVPHSFPPHKVNYRANIWGFKSLGVERILSISAVGGINKTMPPGSIVLLDQIIDMTFGARAFTYYEGSKVVHIDFTNPYCSEMRSTVMQAARNAGVSLVETGTYICVNGPRLETAKEIHCFSMIGADVVGMTAMPEAALARELELCFAGLAVVTNHAAGISERKLTTTEVVETMKGSIAQLKSLLKAAATQFPECRSCPCKEALKEAEM